MGSTTPSQGLRYPFVDDVITDAAQGNLGADIAAKLTTQDTARAAVLTRPRVRVLRNANQSLTSGTDTAVTFDAIGDDPYGLVNLGTFPTRITPGSANTGVWKYSVAVILSVSAYTKVQVTAAVTGTVKSGHSRFVNSNSIGYINSGGLVVVPTGTDYIEIKFLIIGTTPVISAVIVEAWQLTA